MRDYLICENAPEFNRPDPNDPSICLGEVDVYAHDPTAHGGPSDHRLTIRRRWGVNDAIDPYENGPVYGPREWELVRVHHNSAYEARVTGTREVVVVVAHGTLAQVCEQANAERLRAWGRGLIQDAPCDHQNHRAARCGAEERDPPVVFVEGGEPETPDGCGR